MSSWSLPARAHADRIDKVAQNMLSDWHPPALISPYGHGDTAFKVLDVLCVLKSAN